MNRISIPLFALALCACGSSDQTQPAPAAPPQNGAVALTSNGGAEVLPYAAAGTSFDVRLDQPIDTRTSRPGDAISATLAEPIRSADGRVLVPAGARVTGRIAAIDHANEPTIQLGFDAVTLATGPVPLGVRVMSAQQSRYEAVPVPAGVTNAQPGTGQGGAGAPSGEHGPQEISMAKGAVLRLALTRPIVGPVPAPSDK